MNLGTTGTNLYLYLHLGITNNKQEWRKIQKGPKPCDMYVMIYSSLSSRSYQYFKKNFQVYHIQNSANFFMIPNVGVNSEIF